MCAAGCGRGRVGAVSGGGGGVVGRVDGWVRWRRGCGSASIAGVVDWGQVGCLWLYGPFQGWAVHAASLVAEALAACRGGAPVVLLRLVEAMRGVEGEPGRG